MGLALAAPALSNAATAQMADAAAQASRPTVEVRAKTLVELPDRKRNKVLKQLGDAWSWAPPGCFAIYATKSSRKWITIQYSGAQGLAGCSPFDGMEVFTKSGRSWRSVVAGSGLTCDMFKRYLRKGGASPSVIRDLTAVYFCYRP